MEVGEAQLVVQQPELTLLFLSPNVLSQVEKEVRHQKTSTDLLSESQGKETKPGAVAVW